MKDEPPLVDGKKKNNCVYCPKVFEKPSQLKRHIFSHTGQKIHKCQYCNKNFSQKSSLDVHQQLHSGIKPHMCLKCNQLFSQRGNLRLHFKRVHSTLNVPKSTKLYNCDKCPCHFKTTAALGTHLTRVHGRKVTETELQIGKELEVNDNGTQQVVESVQVGDDYVEIIDPMTSKKMIVQQKIINKTRFYVCSICQKPFRRPSDLIRHHRVHTNQRPFCCTTCGRTFKTNGNLKDHEKTHLKHKEVEAKEDLVMKTRRQLTEIEKQLKTLPDRYPEEVVLSTETAPIVTTPQMYTLQKVKFPNYEEAYVMVLYEDQPPLLDREPKINPSATQLNTGFIPLDSILLQKDLKSVNNLSVEKKLNQDPPVQTDLDEPEVLPNVLPEATFTTTHEEDTTVHRVASEKPIKPFKPKITVNRKPDAKHSCPHCKKPFNKASDLERHIRTHTKECPFACNICTRRFAQKGTLKTHMRTHLDSRPTLNCNLCGSVFACKASLDVHKRIHDNILPYKCIYCDKRFRSAGNRSKHHRVHQRLAVEQSKKPEDVQIRPVNFFPKVGDTNKETHEAAEVTQSKSTMRLNENSDASIKKRNTQHECKDCGKNFGSNSLLMRHETVHTHEKRFQCDKCQKSFSQKSYLVDHALSHSDKKRFECKGCDSTYKFRSGLTTHLQNNPNCQS